MWSRNMNAKKDLCKTLYELSGWVTEYWHQTDEYGTSVVRYGAEVPKEVRWTGDELIPAYDCGYLLRKLPGSFQYKGDWYYLMLGRAIDDYDKGYTWAAGYMSISHINERLQQLADTPEDALCKLAIQLFKNGILTKEQ
jgi:hypothetical protein